VFYGEAGRIPEPRCPRRQNPLGGGGQLYLFGRKRGGTESSLRSMGRSGPFWPAVCVYHSLGATSV